jgi:multidrug efflux pump subunit AcrA (membrane-fusion protein)
MTKGSNITKPIVFLNKLLLASFAILFFSCAQKKETARPVLENITESVYASGVIKAKNQYQVFANISGTIHKIMVAENDLVKKGTPLFVVLDKSIILNRENATLAANYAELSANKEKITDAKNSIALAQDKLSNDSLMYQRQKNLWSQNIGTRIELEQRELAYTNSRTALNSANNRYSDLLKELEFKARQAKKNLAISQYRESEFVIKSDMDGKIYSLAKEQGEMINPQTPLAVIGDASNFLVELQIDEYDIVKVKTGQTVLLKMDSYSDQVFEAKVSKIYPLLNERTRSFTAEAEFVKPPSVLIPNLTAEANIVIQTKEKTLTIPRSYLMDDSLVLIGKDKRQKVTTGLKDYQKVEILNGINANDIIYKP